MRQLPPKGLIVSCYLESMRGCEKEFIASVAHLPQVVALRVEGLDNIRWARQIAPHQYIIGLVKRMYKGDTFITPESEFENIIACGANMVATEDLNLGIMPVMPIMIDLYSDDVYHGLIDRLNIGNAQVVLSTTYRQKAFFMLKKLKSRFPNKVNLEGGIETAEEIQKGFDLGADYVTIGKAINDPPTIIDILTKDVVVNG